MRVLFLGDSITDCGHCFTEDNLGCGYVKYLADLSSGYMLSDGSHPTMINSGTDALTFPRMLEKWQRSCQDIPCDLVVLQGGINDVGIIMNTASDSCDDVLSEHLWHRSADAFAKLLNAIHTSGIRNIFVLEPFLFPIPSYRMLWLPTLTRLRHVMADGVQEFSSISPNVVRLLPVQPLLDKAAAQTGIASITEDGIHLTQTGHRLLAEFLFHTIFP